MTVTEHVHRDAAEQVEVAVAVGVPHVRALAAHQDALGIAEGVHERAAIAVGPLGAAGTRVTAVDHDSVGQVHFIGPFALVV